MKTIKRNTLSLKKFQIAKLNNLHSIIGGAANNNNNEEEEESISPTTSSAICDTDTWPIIGG